MYIGATQGQMAVGGAGWSGASWPMGGSGAADRMHSAMSAVSSLISMDPATLASRMQSGSSLADLAAAHGTSASSLLDTIKQAISANRPATAPPLSDALLNRIANRIANHHARPQAPVSTSAMPGTDPAASARSGDGSTTTLWM